MSKGAPWLIDIMLVGVVATMPVSWWIWYKAEQQRQQAARDKIRGDHEKEAISNSR